MLGLSLDTEQEREDFANDVLLALVRLERDEWPADKRAIARAVGVWASDSRGDEVVKQTLARLQKRRFVMSQWRSYSDRPARRYWRLTMKGRARVERVNARG